jgi:hypothetical protein
MPRGLHCPEHRGARTSQQVACRGRPACRGGDHHQLDQTGDGLAEAAIHHQLYCRGCYNTGAVLTRSDPMKKGAVLALFLAAAVAGCADPPRITWVPPAGTDGRQFNKDRLVCRNLSGIDVLLAGSGAPASGAGGLAGGLIDLGNALTGMAEVEQVGRNFAQCMRDTGYVAVTARDPYQARAAAPLDLSAVTVPVAVRAANGAVLTGTATTSLISGGFFTAANARLRCDGQFGPSWGSPTVTITARCSDGRSGVAQAIREAGTAGHGTLRMSDGSEANFIFGMAAGALIYERRKEAPARLPFVPAQALAEPR